MDSTNAQLAAAVRLARGRVANAAEAERLAAIERALLAGGVEQLALQDAAAGLQQAVPQGFTGQSGAGKALDSAAAPAANAGYAGLAGYLTALARHCDFVLCVEKAVKAVVNPLRPLAAAKAVLAAVEAEAARLGLAVAAAVCDERGGVIAAQVMDGAMPVAYAAAVKKAYSAAVTRTDTAALADRFAGVETVDAGITVVPGGLFVGSFGSVGVSGGSVGQDCLLAEVGKRAIAPS